MENGKSICAAEKEAKIEEFSSGLPSFCSLFAAAVACCCCFCCCCFYPKARQLQRENK